MKTITILLVVVATHIHLRWAFSENAGINPPPDGGYLGGNTAEKESALLSLTSGAYNTAGGFFSRRRAVVS